MIPKNRKDEARTKVESYLRDYYFSLDADSFPLDKDVAVGRSSTYRYACSIMRDLEDKFINEEYPELTAGLAIVVTKLYSLPEITAPIIQDTIAKVALYFKERRMVEEYQEAALFQLWNDFMPEHKVNQKW